MVVDTLRHALVLLGQANGSTLQTFESVRWREHSCAGFVAVRPDPARHGSAEHCPDTNEDCSILFSPGSRRWVSLASESDLIKPQTTARLAMSSAGPVGEALQTELRKAEVSCTCCGRIDLEPQVPDVDMPCSASRERTRVTLLQDWATESKFPAEIAIAQLQSLSGPTHARATA